MKKIRYIVSALFAVLLAAGAFMSCGGGGGGAPAPIPATYSVGGVVSGLSGTGLVLQNNGADDLTVASSGTFTFAAKLASSAAYSVTVKTHPVSLTQTCAVTGGSGTVAAANVTSALVSCVTRTYSVGGIVTGLTGTGLTLLNNGGNGLAVATSGTFTFTTWLADGALYSVTVGTQPGNPVQDCVVSSGTGTVNAAAITGVSVACTTTTYAAGSPCANNANCDSGSCECADASCAARRCAVASCACRYVNVSGVCTGSLNALIDPLNACPGYLCDGAGACLTSCSTSGQCDSDRYCVAPNCVTKLALGTACTLNGECISGSCASGHCCEIACPGGTCDAFGQCTGLPNGSTCSESDQCTSGNCSGGTCQ